MRNIPLILTLSIASAVSHGACLIHNDPSPSGWQPIGHVDETGVIHDAETATSPVGRVDANGMIHACNDCDNVVARVDFRFRIYQGSDYDASQLVGYVGERNMLYQTSADGTNTVLGRATACTQMQAAGGAYILLLTGQ